MARNERPNILLVFADQMRGMDTGYAGNPDVKTPHLDRLASEGTWFTTACTNSPVCTPARGSLLTGLYPHRHGAVLNDIPIRTDVPGLASVLRKHGYAAGYVGKWHLDGVPRDRFTPPGPRRCGFDDHWAVHNCSHDYVNGFCYRNDSDKRVPTGPYSPRFYTSEAIDFMRRYREQPFLLVVSWAPPHNPYTTAPEEFRNLYDPAALHLRPNLADPVTPIAAREAPRIREYLAGYYAHISALDHEMGRLMTALSELDLDEDTIVIFTSDHGDMLLSHGYARKQNFYEESINIPFVIRWPGRIPAGVCNRGLIALIDVVPTLYDLAGVPGRDERPALDGISLAEDILDGSGRTKRANVLIFNQGACDEAMAQNIPEWVGVRTLRYTWARRLDGAPLGLFDNAEDPYQMRDLSDRSSDLRSRLEEILVREIGESGFPTEPWREMLVNLGLKELWNRREQIMHPNRPLLIP